MAMSEAVDRKEHTLRRLASEVAGLLLLVAAVLQALLLLSFNHADPSWNHAVDAAPTNILGPPGAIIADLLFQGFGAAAALLPLVLLHWSVQLLLGHGLRRFWARSAAVVAGAAADGAGAGGVAGAQWLAAWRPGSVASPAVSRATAWRSPEPTGYGRRSPRRSPPRSSPPCSSASSPACR